MMTADFTVRLERVFQGPMDLLLHLVREQEVDVHEIEIGKILDGYMAYLKALEQIDIELAGEFVVMAATLMALKSRSLLPSSGEELDLESELDPRDELIQRLLEYRHFKSAAGDLAERFDLRNQIHARGYRQRIDAPEEATLDLSEVTQWDLLATFSRLLRETLAGRSMKIEADSRPLRAYVEDLIGVLRQRPSTALREIVRQAVERGEASKPYLVGTFCALLELVKIGAVSVIQERRGDDIALVLRDDLAGDLDEVVHGMGFDDELLAFEAAREGAPPAGAPEAADFARAEPEGEDGAEDSEDDFGPGDWT